MSAPVPKAGERKDKGGFGNSCTTHMLTADTRVLLVQPSMSHVPLQSVCQDSRVGLQSGVRRRVLEGGQSGH